MSLYELLSVDSAPVGLESFEWGRPAAREVADQMRRDGAHDPGHLSRVFENARAIVSAERPDAELDWEVVVAAVLFHDVVNPPKDSDAREDASSLSAERASRFFVGRDGWDDARRSLLADAIEQHSYSRGLAPTSREAAILQDADRLEAIGAVGLARCFAVAGSLDSSIAHPDDPFARDRTLDDTAYAVDHFFEKLLHLAETFRTDAGRRLAGERHDVLVEFLDQLAREVGAEPPDID